MKEVDLVIRGAQWCRRTRIFEAAVAIAGERIVAVGHDDTMPSAREEMRADGLHLLPAPSTATCISAIPAIRTRRPGRPARRPPRSAA
jgi:hypothetical protein